MGLDPAYRDGVDDPIHQLLADLLRRTLLRQWGAEARSQSLFPKISPSIACWPPSSRQEKWAQDLDRGRIEWEQGHPQTLSNQIL